MGPWACPSGPEAACAFICFSVSPGSPHSELSLPFIKASQWPGEMSVAGGVWTRSGLTGQALPSSRSGQKSMLMPRL